MDMKKIMFYALAASALCVSCQKEGLESSEVAEFSGPAEFTATLEDTPVTKIHLGEYEGKKCVLWDSGFDVAICAGTAVSTRYAVTSDDTPYASLVPKSSSASGDAIGANVGYYPYPNSGTINVQENNDGTYTILNAAFSDAQNYQVGSFADRGFPLVAVSDGIEDTSLNFKNAAGGICINLVGEGKVKQLKLEPNASGTKISNSAAITVSNTDGQDFEITSSGFNSGHIFLNVNQDPVQLDPEVPTPFYFGVAPQTFKGGFKITVTDEDGTKKPLQTTKDQTVVRSKILDMPVQSFKYRVADLSAVTLQKNGDNLVHEFSDGNHAFAYKNLWNAETGKADYSYRGIIFKDLSGDFTGRALHMSISYCDLVLKVRVRYVDETGTAKEITHSGLYSSVQNLTGVPKDMTVNFAHIVGEDNVNVLSNVTCVEFWCGSANGTTINADNTTLRLIVDEIYVD